MAHKLGSALTPARGVQAQGWEPVWGEGGGPCASARSAPGPGRTQGRRPPWAGNATSWGRRAPPEPPRPSAARREPPPSSGGAARVSGVPGTLSAGPRPAPPPSSRWSSSRTCRRASGRPRAPGSPACSSICEDTGVTAGCCPGARLPPALWPRTASGRAAPASLTSLLEGPRRGSGRSRGRPRTGTEMLTAWPC